MTTGCSNVGRAGSFVVPVLKFFRLEAELRAAAACLIRSRQRSYFSGLNTRPLSSFG